MSDKKLSAAALRAKARAAKRSLERKEDTEQVKGSAIFTTGETPSVEGTQAEGLKTVNEESNTETEDDEPKTRERNDDEPKAQEESETEEEEEDEDLRDEPELDTEDEPEPPEVVQEKEEEVKEPEVILESKQNLNDTEVFKQLTKTSNESGIDGTDSYAELVENMVSSQCQLSGVKNLDLTTFGLRAQVLKFPNLSVMEYGIHKFLGAPFTDKEKDLIVHKLGLHVALSEKEQVIISAVQEVKDTRGMSFYSLMFSEEIAQKFADMFNYTVKININEPDVSKLLLVVNK